MLEFGFVLSCCVGETGGFHGFIMWFKYILGVFLIYCKCE